MPEFVCGRSGSLKWVPWTPGRAVKLGRASQPLHASRAHRFCRCSPRSLTCILRVSWANSACACACTCTCTCACQCACACMCMCPYFLSKLVTPVFSTSGGYCDYTAPFPATPSSRLRASGSKGSVNPPFVTFRWISLPQTRAPMRRLALLALLVSAASGFLIPTMPARSGISVARHTHAVMNAPVGRGVDGQPRRKGEPPACV